MTQPNPPAPPTGSSTPIPLSATALYTRPRSIYLALGFECWGIERDARLYPGPQPIIAHPPCGHWGTYHHLCKLPGKDCAPIAIEQARKFGGIVEHPATSMLFTHTACPRKPGQLDTHGGQIITILQGDYGHPAAKPTKLYIVGLSRPASILPPTRQTSFKPAQNLSRAARQGTPLRFALLLIALISQVET